jgi:hypothetical protein
MIVYFCKISQCPWPIGLFILVEHVIAYLYCSFNKSCEISVANIGLLTVMTYRSAICEDGFGMSLLLDRSGI